MPAADLPPTLRPLYGHDALRRRLADALQHGRLPASLLFTGTAGVGKQRLALWLAQRMHCEGPADATEPCGSCQPCRLVLRGQHPDVHWFFPRPRLKDGDPSSEDVRNDLAEGVADRMKAHGLWSASSGTEALYVHTVRALVGGAQRRPAMARRSVYVIGEADRMVAQEGSDQAANAFLKLLEEPPPHVTLLLTTSEPGALLPTIRSRVVTVRVPPVSAEAMQAFLADDAVRAVAGHADAAAAAGAPGRLIGDDDRAAAREGAEGVYAAARAPRGPAGEAHRQLVAARQGVAGARGAFSDMLESLVVVLHEETRSLVAEAERADDPVLARRARRTAAAVALVEAARTRAQGNVSPHLLTAVLLDDLAELLAAPSGEPGGTSRTQRAAAAAGR